MWLARYTRLLLTLSLAGPAALPDHAAAPRADDGGSQRQRQVHRLAGAPQGPGETGGGGGGRTHHRPQGELWERSCSGQSCIILNLNVVDS